MKTLIITEVRVYKVNNKYYTDNSFSKVLEKYSFKFENISLLTRITDHKEVPNGYIDISSYISKFINLGQLEKYIIKSNSKQISKIVFDSDFIILRVPSLACSLTYKYIKRFKKKYMIEAMGCAWDDYWNHGILGKILAPYMFFKTKNIVKKANYAVYVTKDFLQKRYPCKGKSINASNVNIDKTYDQKNYNHFNKANFTMFTAAALNVKYKGQNLVIKAIKDLKKEGINIKYYLAGKGDNIYLKKIAKKNGVSENIIFLGMISKKELFNQMIQTDIYIQPSLQEGLPRSLIEAMSCGCVCLGSTTAGIPELLQKDQIFIRGSKKAIIKAIKNNLNNDFNKISKQNIEKSKEYLADILNKKRFGFYEMILYELNNKTNK